MQGERLSTPSPRQVRILVDRSSRSAVTSLYHLKMEEPFTPGRTLAQRTKDIRAKYKGQALSETLPVPAGARFSPTSTRKSHTGRE